MLFPAFGKTSSNYCNFQTGIVDMAQPLLEGHYTDCHTQRKTLTSVCVFLGQPSTPVLILLLSAVAHQRPPALGLPGWHCQVEVQQWYSHGDKSTDVSVT